MAFTVMGHTGVTFGTLDWLFPYDSFHMPLFVFISGYFFRTEEVSLSNTGHFLVKQAKRLLIPFGIWNLLYGLLSLFVYAVGDVTWCHGDEFWQRLLVRPFTNGNCFFEFNAPSWFILMLFEVKCINWFFRTLLNKQKHREAIITVLYLLLAILAVSLARGLTRTPLLIKATRAIYMLFWFQMGTIYNKYLERRDKSGNIVYLSIVLVIQIFIWIVCRDTGIIAGVWNSEFSNNALLTILSAGTGIAFFLRIARILSPCAENSKAIAYVSTHTFSIMMHQMTGFFVLNLLFLGVTSALGAGDFDVEAFRTDFWYRYLPFGLSNLRFIYAIAGFAFPLGGCILWERFLRVISSKTGISRYT